MQPGLDKNIFFVMEFGQNPPVTTAIYLWKFENSSSQLNLLSECLLSITELDEKRTCVLYKWKKWINFLCLFTHFRPLDQWDTFFWYFITHPYSPQWQCAIHHERDQMLVLDVVVTLSCCSQFNNVRLNVAMMGKKKKQNTKYFPTEEFF